LEILVELVCLSVETVSFISYPKKKERPSNNDLRICEMFNR